MFDERARSYRDFKRKPGTRQVEGQVGDLMWGERGPRRQSSTYTLEDREGNQLLYALTVVQDESGADGLPRVEEFSVELEKR